MCRASGIQRGHQPELELLLFAEAPRGRTARQELLTGASVLDRLPSIRWKGDAPQAWSGRGKFHRYQVALVVFHGRAHHPAILLDASLIVRHLDHGTGS